MKLNDIIFAYNLRAGLQQVFTFFSICVHYFQIFSKKDGKGTPPLVTAVNSGNLEICRYLLENGAKIDATDRRLKRSALQYAILAKNLDIFDLLLK